MTSTDKMRTITQVHATAPSMLAIVWSDGAQADLDMRQLIAEPAFQSLQQASVFEAVSIGDWGHGLAWPSDVEIGADRLWLETLSANRREDTRQFLEWRLRHALSLSKAAEALGLSRRMVAYYSNGEKRVPRHVQLACRGWEVGDREVAAA